MAKTSLEKQRERDLKLVKARFIYHECKNGGVKFSAGPWWKGDKMRTYNLRDGDITELPLIDAEKINGNCWYGINEHKQDSNGNRSIEIGRKVQRIEFVPLVFSYDSDLQPASTDVVSVKLG